VLVYRLQFLGHRNEAYAAELSPNVGDGLKDQAAAVWA